MSVNSVCSKYVNEEEEITVGVVSWVGDLKFPFFLFVP